MKRKGFIFDKVCELDNILLAINKASKGKRKRKSVQKVLEKKEFYAKQIQQMLKNESYTPSPYNIKNIVDKSSTKIREIAIPKFYPDQIIQWALMLQLENIFMKSMYYYTCASIKFRGAKHGIKYLDKVLVTDRKNTKYCLKLDIRKYYPSVNNKILKQKFRTIIKDEKVLSLLDKIVDSNEKGLPIGNFTSQWFANFYLQDLDHFIKEQLKVKHYIRYMDDFVLFYHNKKQLHKFRVLVEQELNKLGLILKSNWTLFKFSSRPLDFLGYKFYRDYKTLRRRIFLRIKRRFKRINNFFKKYSIVTFKNATAVISYWGRISEIKSQLFYERYVDPYINLKQCKEVISHASKKRSE
ncbi:MAG: reverse transcriptase domain-containing protein [Clostridia bacterium]|nr:reverse transcriptase domain-containing protein [Clostridia bacterium]